jgi:hypothetical protein
MALKRQGRGVKGPESRHKIIFLLVKLLNKQKMVIFAQIAGA